MAISMYISLMYNPNHPGHKWIFKCGEVGGVLAGLGFLFLWVFIFMGFYFYVRGGRSLTGVEGVLSRSRGGSLKKLDGAR